MAGKGERFGLVWPRIINICDVGEGQLTATQGRNVLLPIQHLASLPPPSPTPYTPFLIYICPEQISLRHASSKKLTNFPHFPKKQGQVLFSNT
jgi:hypothetical protein